MRSMGLLARNWRRLVALCSMAVALAPGVALADPPVELLAPEPLAYDLEALRSLGGIVVTLHNTTGKPRRVTVRIAGLPAGGKNGAALAGLFDPAGVTRVVPASGDRTVTVPLAGAQNPAPGSYAATLVAIPSAPGAVARRTLTLTVAAAPPAPPKKGATLDAFGLPDVTIPATNFLPSPLAPLGPTLIVLAAVLAILLAIWWTRLRTRGHAGRARAGVWLCLACVAAGVALQAFGSPISRPAFVVAAVLMAGSLVVRKARSDSVRDIEVPCLAVLVFLAATVGEFPDDIAGQPGARLIVSTSLPVSNNVKQGRVGVVLDTEGDIAELQVDERSRLRPTGLEHAGAHNGSVDLNGALPEGSAKATVNVRDWWLWAVAAITLGVLVGYCVRRWYDRDRPRDILRLRGRELVSKVADEPLLASPVANWIPVQRVEAAVRDILELLDDDGTPEQAEKDLDALESYVEATVTLALRVAELKTLAGEFESTWSATPLGVSRDEVRALRAADRTVASQFDSREPDAGRKLLDEGQTTVGSVSAHVREALDDYSQVLSWIRSVNVALEAAEPDAEAELDKTKAELEADARKVLRAADLEGARAAYAAAAARLPATISTWTRSRLADVGPQPTRPSATIEHEVVPAAGAGAGANADANIDDTFRFRAILHPPPSQDLKITWEFDESPTPVADHIPPSGASAWMARRYRAGGVRRVRLLAADGSELASTTLPVSAPSRLASDKRALAQRDRAFFGIAVALTIASGVSALYLVDPTWGTNDDYVKAMLWGAVLPEGAALVAAAIARRFPSAKS